ncbi:putative lipase ROG1 isoform X2 [Telopea speciosissima]|uniref:putative lipase ROG1 isoform X2 n=1 Tax=Telopea speciosissima TaxID=54955 RepID=UPI001CC59C17|nr:putative lipase ROG1 isoform X2 [Telopea speciosissima]
MASLELQSTSETVCRADVLHVDSSEKNTKNAKKNKNKIKLYVWRGGCFKSESDHSTTHKPYGDRSPETKTGTTGEQSSPTHLVVMVNGIIGSARNWKFAAKKFLEKYPQDLIVHCSECNHSMLTLDGVDVMGERLAEEVISIVKCRPYIQKISFIGHSLGGLVARYAIGRLYGQNSKRQTSDANDVGTTDEAGIPCMEEKSKGKIAELEPMNFITVATPHLGSRGNKQVPIFCGLHILEKMASRASWMIGRTGKHLFLTDNDDAKLPLLLQMVDDCGDLHFMSALQSFKRRVAYANACYDHIVGWSTSSIRCRDELPKRKSLSRNEKYPHIINVETPKITSPQQEVLSEAKVNGGNTMDMEEKMIRGLTKVGWERVDVSFSRSKQRIFAHNTIQVKTYCINSDGADVILHMIDNFLL